VVNTALWLGLARARYELGKGPEAVTAADNVLLLDNQNSAAVVLRIRWLRVFWFWWCFDHVGGCFFWGGKGGRGARVSFTGYE
jgi:hypothetical protein